MYAIIIYYSFAVISNLFLKTNDLPVISEMAKLTPVLKRPRQVIQVIIAPYP